MLGIIIQKENLMDNKDKLILQECIVFVETYFNLKKAKEVADRAYMVLGNRETAVNAHIADDTLQSFTHNMKAAIELMDKLITVTEKQDIQLKSDRN